MPAVETFHLTFSLINENQSNFMIPVFNILSGVINKRRVRMNRWMDIGIEKTSDIRTAKAVKKEKKKESKSQ